MGESFLECCGSQSDGWCLENTEVGKLLAHVMDDVPLLVCGPVPGRATPEIGQRSREDRGVGQSSQSIALGAVVVVVVGLRSALKNLLMIRSGALCEWPTGGKNETVVVRAVVVMVAGPLQPGGVVSGVLVLPSGCHRSSSPRCVGGVQRAGT